MISIAIMAAVLTSAQYNYPTQPSGSAPSQAGREGGFDAAPFAQAYRKCFESAENETRTEATDLKQQKFDACRGQHDAIVDHVTAKLEGSKARQVKRALNRALGDVEKSYAKRMGVAIAPTQK